MIIRPLHTTYLVILILYSTSGYGQRFSNLRIEKVKGTYTKKLKLPLYARIITQEEEKILIRIDSISKDYVYGNNGKDSIAVQLIKVINLRGLTEIAKYTALSACLAITVGATYFTIYALNYPVVLDGNNNPYKYIGMAYFTTFAALSTVLILYPRTRFEFEKYSFKME